MQIIFQARLCIIKIKFHFSKFGLSMILMSSFSIRSSNLAALNALFFQILSLHYKQLLLVVALVCRAEKKLVLCKSIDVDRSQS